MAQRRWLIVGTGGVGGYVGGHLARDYDATFLARGAHLEAMRTKGLRVETVDGTFHIDAPQAVTTLDGTKPFDVVLFCVKTYDNESAAKSIAPAVEENTIVISVQNGMYNDKILRELLPTKHVYPGLAQLISAVAEPGVIRQSGGPRTVFFGDPLDSANEELRAVAHDMREAGVDATASPSIEREQWDKFVFVTAFSGMTALCRSPIGPILNDPLAMDLYRRCVAETIAVAQASNADIDPDAFDTAMHRTDAFKTQEHATSSLLRDVLAGRPTEIESLSGAVVREAAQYGVGVPIHSMIYTAINLASRRPKEY